MTYERRLVTFEDPPVAEVAIALFTTPRPEISQSLMGAFWAKHLRSDYPESQDQPPTPPSPEFFDVSPPAVPEFMIGGPPFSGRQWYLSDDQTRLVQIQNDRIVLNWRRLETDAYPRYETLREEMSRVYALWEGFMSDESLSVSPLTLGEVTYINYIPVAAVESASSSRSGLRSISVAWPDNIGTPESLQLGAQFRTDSPDGTRGRTYISLSPARSANNDVLALSIAVRGALDNVEFHEALEWLEFAHNQVVNTFADIVDDSLKSLWGYGR